MLFVDTRVLNVVLLYLTCMFHRSTFPDLDYRAHDFRIDEQDPMTIRVTARIVGTMRGELRLRNEVLPPNGKRMRCPPGAFCRFVTMCL